MDLFSHFTFEVSWTESIGWIADIIFATSYALVSRGILDGDGKTFNWCNLVGAMCFMTYAFLIGSAQIFSLEILWASIAGTALYKAYHRDPAEKEGGNE